MNSKIIPLLLISVLFVAGCTAISNPSIKIVFPASGQTISGSIVNVQVTASNVKLVAADGSIVEGEGHLHLFLDNGSYILSPTGTYTFENVPAGMHTLRAELHKGDHSQYYPSGYDKPTPIAETVTFTTVAEGALPPVSTVAVREFNVTAMRFAFEPSTVTVNKGDQVILHMTSTDVTHGISLPDYNILQTLPPGETKTVTFTADKAGQFTFFCSVLCGSGNSDMRGKLVVNP